MFLGTSAPLSAQGHSAAQLAQLLRNHALVGHVAGREDEFGLGEADRAVLAKFTGALRIGAWQRVRYSAKVRDALEGAGIPGVFFKGVVMSQVIWDRATARGAGDIDVLVPDDGLQDAIQALIAAGGRIRPNQVDLRPKPLDRAVHHAISLRWEGTEVDVHYRLDQIRSVLALPFHEILGRTQQVTLAGETFRTLDDELTLAVLAANGGRDLWGKWGQVLDFATLNRRVTLGPATSADLGLGYRFEVGQAVAEMLGAPRRPEISRRARRLAGHIGTRHAQGVAASPVRARLDQWGDGLWTAATVPSVESYRWLGLQRLWSGDETGRGAEDGIGEDVGIAVRRVLRAHNRPVMEPIEHLADLIDAGQRGEIDRDAFAALERTMRADALGREELAVLTFLAPLMAEQLPDHGFTGRAVGIRRKARVKKGLSEATLAAAQRYAGDGIVLGDLGASRVFNHGDERLVTNSTLIVPELSRSQAWRVARAAARGDATVVDVGRWPVLERYQVRVAIHRSLSIAFDFPGVRAAVDDTPEWVMYDSLVRSALGAPKVQWYLDALKSQDLVDWNRVWEVAGIAGWYDPVAQACAVLKARLGWEVPLRLGMDRLVDSGYFNGSRVRPVRLSWLGLRLARHHLPGG